jgi:3-oxoacyl-[acyl-carrier protein] reductase
MVLSFIGRRVLVTAGSRGLGAAMAIEFAKSGAQVILVGRSSVRMEETIDVIRKVSDNSFQPSFIEIDLAIKTAPEELFVSLQQADLMPDVIIHNLGGTLGVRSLVGDFDSIERVLWVNVLFAVRFNSLIVPHLKERGDPRLIHISSISAKSLRGAAPYAMSKACLDAYIVCLARELASSSIVVCGVRPGAFISEGGDWDKNLANRPEMVADFLRHHHASGRLGLVSDIVPFVLMLASSYSKWAHGSIIDVDGGTM